MTNTKSIKQSLGYRVFFLLIAAVIICIGIFVAPPTGLEVAGWRMLMLCLAVVVLFFSEAIPVMATCMLIIIMMKYLNIVTFSKIAQTSTNTTFWFILFSFGIGAAMKNTNIAAILLRALFKLVKGSSKKLVSVIVILSAIISTVVNNGVAQVVVIALILTMFKNIGDPEPGTSNLCKGIMIAACVGSQTGGLALPCSNAVNAVAMNLAIDIGGLTEMTFLQWAIFGVPAAIIVTAFAAWFVPFITKPEQLTKEQFDSMEKMFDTIPSKLQKKDWTFIVIMIAMIACWVSSTWVKVFDLPTVAMAGVFIMMLPGIELLTVKDYIKNFSVTQIVVLLCLFPFASAMASSGAGEWVVGNVFSGASNWGSWTFYVIAVLVAFVVHLLVPAGSANCSLSCLAIGPVAVACGIPAAAILFLVGVQAGSSYILPVDGIWSYTFGYGYYKFSDPLRKLWPLVLFIIIFAITIVPLLTSLYTSMGLIA